MIIEFSGDGFAKTLAHLRKKHRLSYRALGRIIGVSPHLLRGIEKGIVCPALSVEAVQRMREAFQLSDGEP